MFRRRRRGAHGRSGGSINDAADEAVADADELVDAGAAGEDADDAEDQGEALGRPVGKARGPWDVSEPTPDIPRVDLGALRLPILEDAEVQLSVTDDQIVSATVIHGKSALQIQAFAAPKSRGIWPEVRTEIARSLEQAGGHAHEAAGPFGPELRARVRVDSQGEGVEIQQARFVGVDGPRWLVRGVFTGPAGSDPGPATALDRVFRDAVVVRGDAPMPPKEPLPLRLPPELAAQEEEKEPERPTIEMLRRGPEITETR